MAAASITGGLILSPRACEELSPRTSKSFIERVQAIDPETASIYRDTLLADEEAHEWLAPKLLSRYAVDGQTQQRCLEALQKGCELFGRAIQSFNRSVKPKYMS